jgi:hypothetical protein
LARERPFQRRFSGYTAHFFVPLLRCEFTCLNLIDIAPDPGFAGFYGTDERVLRFMEMLGSVFVFGRIATTDMTANQAQAQVNPSVAGFDAFLTHMLGGFSEFNLVKVRTLVCH